MMILVMGHRRGLTKALEKKGIPFVVWNDKPISDKVKAVSVIVAPFPQVAEDLKPLFDCTENVPKVVIAGTENSVFPASKTRMLLDARRNPHAIAIRCTDKLTMKEYLKERDIPMTEFLPGNLNVDPEEIFEDLGQPVIVKPRKSSGGRGVQKIADEEELESALTNRVLVEKRIEGSEGSVESLIQNNEILFTNITQYHSPGYGNLVPGHFSKKDASDILELNKKVIKNLKIQWGLTHLEFYRTKDGILFGEIALRPPGGYIMEALQLAYGISFWDVFVDVEMGTPVQAPPVRQLWAASYSIYPKPGIIERLPSLEELETLPSVVKLKCRLLPGDVIPDRAGVGENFGHALLVNEDRKQLRKDLTFLHKAFAHIR